MFADFTENLQFHANSDIDPLLEEHGPVDEEAEENEIKENYITLISDQIVNVNVASMTQ